MAIKFNAVSVGASTGTSPLTWSHTNASNSNRLLVVAISVGATTSPNCSGVTYNGSAMTLLGSARSTSTIQATLWYLLNPSTGANTISATVTGTGNLTANGAATSYYNVKQSAQPDAVAGNIGSSSVATLSVTTVADNSWVVGFVTANGVTTPVAALTSRQTFNNSGGTVFKSNLQDNNGPKTPAGAITVNWTGTLSAWGAQAASFSPDNTLSINVSDTTSMSDSKTVNAPFVQPILLPAIIFDAISTSGNFQQNTTWSHTVGSGLNTILIVQISVYTGAGSGNPVFSVTYNSSPMTLIRQDDSSDLSFTTALFYLLSPTVGLNTIALNNSNDPGVAQASTAGAISLKNVSQSNPITGQATNTSGLTPTGTGMTTTTLTVDPNSWINDIVATQNFSFPFPDPWVDGGQIERWQIQNTFSFDGNSMSSTKGPVGGSQTMTWNLNDTGYWISSAAGIGVQIVGDTTAVTESVTVVVQAGPLTINVSDTTVISENLFYNPDVVVMVERSSVEIVLLINVSDTTVITENVSMSVPLVISVGDFTPQSDGSNGIAGYNVIGANTYTTGTSSFINPPGLMITIPIASGITKFSAYVANTLSSDSINFSIYSGTPSVRGSLLTSSLPATVTTSFGWVDFSFASPFSVAAGTYWIQFNGDGGTGPGGNVSQIKYDPNTGLGGTSYFQGDASTIYGKDQYSMYATCINGATNPLLEIFSFENVSDTTAITEAVTVEIISFVNVSDTTAITDSTTENLFSLINVSETSAITELVTIEIFSFINVSDTTTITESVTISIVSSNTNVSVSDTTAITELVTLELFSYINVSDTSVVTDVPIINLLSYINVSDTTAVTDIPTIEILDLINKSDTTVVTELVTMELFSFFNVNDTTVVTDTSTIFIPIFNINISDTTPMAESAALEDFEQGVVISDMTVVSDSPTIFIPILKINVSDTTLVTESSSVSIVGSSPTPSVFDTTIVTDIVTIFIPYMTISVSDTTTITEISNVEDIEQGIGVTDTTVVLELTIISIPFLYVNVFDTTTVIDLVNMGKSNLFLSVSDTTVISEFIKVGSKFVFSGANLILYLGWRSANYILQTDDELVA